MKILLDANVDPKLRSLGLDVQVLHVKDMGWQGLSNGLLLKTAEEAGFDALITADRQMAHQQSLRGRRLAVLILVMGKVRPGAFESASAEIARAVGTLRSGEFVELDLRKSDG